jgi:hypothetical protein
MKDGRAITGEEFVLVWQSSKSVSEVAKRTGMTVKAASVRASNYRKKKVPLKLMNGDRAMPHNDWEKLAKLARKLAEDAAADAAFKARKQG